MVSEAELTVYGAPWCSDCRRAKEFLGEQRVRYNWVDIDQDEEGRKYVRQANNGKQIIPTIVFGDGSILVEPTNAELASKMGISPTAKRTFYDLIVGRQRPSWTDRGPVRRPRGHRDPGDRAWRSRGPGWGDRTYRKTIRVFLRGSRARTWRTR